MWSNSRKSSDPAFRVRLQKDRTQGSQTVPLEVIAHYQDGMGKSQTDQIDVKTRAGSQGKPSDQ